MFFELPALITVIDARGVHGVPDSWRRATAPESTPATCCRAFGGCRSCDRAACQPCQHFLRVLADARERLAHAGPSSAHRDRQQHDIGRGRRRSASAPVRRSLSGADRRAVVRDGRSAHTECRPLRVSATARRRDGPSGSRRAVRATAAARRPAARWWRTPVRRRRAREHVAQRDELPVADRADEQLFAVREREHVVDAPPRAPASAAAVRASSRIAACAARTGTRSSRTARSVLPARGRCVRVRAAASTPIAPNMPPMMSLTDVPARSGRPTGPVM